MKIQRKMSVKRRFVSDQNIHIQVEMFFTCKNSMNVTC